MNHYFPNVPGLGNVAVSRHAQEKMELERVSEESFARVLASGADVPDGMDVVRRCGEGLQIIILLKPTPFRGAKLVKTVFRTKGHANARTVP